MRVVMVSKALVVNAYRQKLEELAKFPELELTAIVPDGWQGRYDSAPLEQAAATGYELVIAPIIFNGQHHLHFYPTLKQLLRQRRPEILHMDEEPYNLATWHALQVGAAIGVRSLFFTWQNLRRRYPWPFRHFESANYRRAAFAIAGNRAATQVLRAKGYAGPLAVIPQFGIDPQVFWPLPGQIKAATGSERTDSSPGAGLVVGYAGRLVPEKGVDVLLRACAARPTRDWRLRIMGDGPERSNLVALAGDLKITDRIEFMGHRSSSQAPEFYRTLDVLVLPSLSRSNWMEQFGRVLIEAMACEVPVIGSNCGEIPAVIGDAGIVFPEGDASALAESITMLEEDAEHRAELARRGRERVLARFTQAKIAAETVRVYRQMLGGPLGADALPREERSQGS